MKKFQITAGILAAASIALIVIFTLVQNSFAAKLDTQRASERWVSDGSKYAQLSAFISPEAGFDESSADFSLVTALDTAMTSASISPAIDGARIYAYAYSAETGVTISRESSETGATIKSGVGATATGVGSDFFLFHPLKLLSGHYFDPTEAVLNDQIVIDENLAWQFFGSPDVVGYELIINGRRCYISGVAALDPDYAEYYGDGGRLYMSYSLLKELKEGLPITCYELCMPSPVTGFAYTILDTNLGIDEQYVEIVENSARFTDRGLLGNLSDFSKRSVREKLVAYPYWENTAVIIADRAALLYVFKLIPIVLIVLLIVTEIVLAYSNRKKIAGLMIGKIKSAWNRYKQDKRRNTPKNPTPKKHPALNPPTAQPINTLISDKEKTK